MPGSGSPGSLDGACHGYGGSAGRDLFYIIRFLLGAAEAGFFPAIILYLTLWFPARQRVAVLGIFILAQPIANAIGAPISGLLLKMDGILGLTGWQWMYIIEGVPAMLMAVVALKAMTDYPRDAMWLTRGTHMAAGQNGRRGRGQGDRTSTASWPV